MLLFVEGVERIIRQNDNSTPHELALGKRYYKLLASAAQREQDVEARIQLKRSADAAVTNPSSKRRCQSFIHIPKQRSRCAVVSPMWVSEGSSTNLSNHMEVDSAFVEYADGKETDLSQLRAAFVDQNFPYITPHRRFRLLQMMLEFLIPSIFSAFVFSESHHPHDLLLHSDLAEISTLLSQIRQAQQEGHEHITTVRILKAQLAIRFEGCVTAKRKGLASARKRRHLRQEQVGSPGLGQTSPPPVKAAKLIEQEFIDEYGENFTQDLQQGRSLKIISDVFGSEYILALIPSGVVRPRLCLDKPPRNWRMPKELAPGE